jgi:predicted Holliday junction resolvase-like endonuclease
MAEFMIVFRFLLLLMVLAVIMFLVYREIKSIQNKTERKEALKQALEDIHDTIYTGEQLQKVDEERLKRAKAKIDAVLNTDLNTTKKGKV